MQIALIAAVVHDVLKAGTFDNLFDLAETVKTRCARLKIPYDAGGISDALRLVERTRPLLVRSPPVARTPPRNDVRPLSRDEAAAILARVYAALARRDQRQDAEAS